MKLVGSALGIPFVDLREVEIEAAIALKIPEKVARKYHMIPFKQTGNQLVVAMEDPVNLLAVEDGSLVSQMELIPVQAALSYIDHAIDRIYGANRTQQVVEALEKEVTESRLEESVAEEATPFLERKEEVSSIIQLLDSIVEQAAKYRASDIHIEPGMHHLKIRYRVDGVLQEIHTLPKETIPSFLSRIKILSKLDITEKRLPQDGRMEKQIGIEKIDMRVSTFPTQFGEKVVIRMIYGMHKQLKIEELGLGATEAQKLYQLINEPNGIILVTGPTGSGKSTTLAAVLKELGQKPVNIITVEDPIENTIEGITQSAVNVKIGYSFAVALRAILRQDPDVIMIGEIRDKETSDIAIRAAITGHLVLSTLHTNSAATAITRLLDMGAEEFMVRAAIKGVIAQRLIRRLCDSCKIVQELSEIEASLYGTEKNTVVYQKKGCSFCNGTGYRGRIGIYEVMLIEEYKQVSTRSRLWESACFHLVNGRTSLEEILKLKQDL